MAAMRVTWVFLQAVLLWDVHCTPLKKGMAHRYEGGSTGGSAQGLHQPEEQPDARYYYGGYNVGLGGHDAASAMSPPGAQAGSSVDLSAPPPGGYGGGYPSPSGMSEDVSWVMPPSLFSGGQSNVSPPEPAPGPGLVPGEMSRFESTQEDGAYQSETQERDLAAAAVSAAGVSAGPQATSPWVSFGHSDPYDWLFLRGLYPPGTYTHASSTVEHGRDDWQEKHYIGYEYPASPGEEQHKVQTYPADQLYQRPGLGEATGPRPVKPGEAVPYHWEY